MKDFRNPNKTGSDPGNRRLGGRLTQNILNIVAVCALTIIIFYLSLLITSLPTLPYERGAVNKAIDLLEQRGFERDVFLLKQIVTFRSTNNWLNAVRENENAYASTNFPFALVTLHPDFFIKTIDDTERAMILLHEAQHLQGKNESEAYEFVWRNRKKLGWTQLSHGTTQTYVSIALQTRESAPHLFTCTANVWNDCTEDQKVTTHLVKKTQSK